MDVLLPDEESVCNVERVKRKAPIFLPPLGRSLKSMRDLFANKVYSSLATPRSPINRRASNDQPPPALQPCESVDSITSSGKESLSDTCNDFIRRPSIQLLSVRRKPDFSINSRVWSMNVNSTRNLYLNMIRSIEPVSFPEPAVNVLIAKTGIPFRELSVQFNRVEEGKRYYVLYQFIRNQCAYVAFQKCTCKEILHTYQPDNPRHPFFCAVFSDVVNLNHLESFSDTKVILLHSDQMAYCYNMSMFSCNDNTLPHVKKIRLTRSFTKNTDDGHVAPRPTPTPTPTPTPRPKRKLYNVIV